MIFTRRKASDWIFNEDIEINTLEELLNYVSKLDCHEIVLGFNGDEKPIITDYDSYLE